MNIIILGAGQVGSTVATELAKEESNEITVIDTNQQILSDLQDRLDLRTICGNGSYPGLLEEAGADDADMIIALTNSDEINMVACQIASSLFHTPTKIARIRSPEYLGRPGLFAEESIPVDVIISPESLVTDYIYHLIEHPSALQVLDFAQGRAQLVAVKAYDDGLLVGHELRTTTEHLRGVDMRVAAIFRDGQSIQPSADCVIEAGDEVFFLAAREHIPTVISEMRKLDKPNKRIMLAGGGNIGGQLAARMEHDYQVKVIEAFPGRARELSAMLDSAIVLLGDAANPDLLQEENVESMDVFCALTNDDEANILSSMLAKRMGARKVMSLINRPAYVDLVESGLIDIAISPHQVTIGALLAHIRRGDVVAVHALRRGSAEAIEAIAHGDKTSSKVVGRTIEEIRLPEGARISAIVRGNDVLIAHHDTVIESEDHVILFLTNKKKIAEVEKLFQVGITYF
ncbi:MAG TPA: Trk system potassium transporter TrkA [Gammaproteobacteria bacterium]|nr:Trk system potassium transporter TrkA [Gammaproteobacteria bacterium]